LNLLTKLIQSDRRFDVNTKETYTVNNYYINKFNKENNILFAAYYNDIPVGYIFGYIKYQSGDFAYYSVAQIDSLYVEVKNTANFTEYNIYLAENGSSYSNWNVSLIAHQDSLFSYIGDLKYQY